jgi:hypothetical protein
VENCVVGNCVTTVLLLVLFAEVVHENYFIVLMCFRFCL